MSRSNQQPQRREPITDRNHVMTFGRYKGFSIGEIIENEPSYLEWLTKNTDFELDHKLMDEVEGAYVNAAFEAELHKEIKSIQRDYRID